MAKKQPLRKPGQSFCSDGDLYPDAPTLCFGLFRPKGENTPLLKGCNVCMWWWWGKSRGEGEEQGEQPPGGSQANGETSQKIALSTWIDKPSGWHPGPSVRVLLANWGPCCPGESGKGLIKKFHVLPWLSKCHTGCLLLSLGADRSHWSSFVSSFSTSLDPKRGPPKG